MASFNGQIELVRLLLDRGADLHTQDDYALRWAAENGCLEVVRMLLDRGADALADGSMALRNSVANGNCDTAMLLIAYGADLGVEINADRDAKNSRMIYTLGQIKPSRAEKGILFEWVEESQLAAVRSGCSGAGWWFCRISVTVLQ